MSGTSHPTGERHALPRAAHPVAARHASPSSHIRLERVRGIADTVRASRVAAVPAHTSSTPHERSLHARVQDAQYHRIQRPNAMLALPAPRPAVARHIRPDLTLCATQGRLPAQSPTVCPARPAYPPTLPRMPP
ncbi:hypothetical protein HYPSUDRAFT_204588 [Hypholoma sublateritium FD-334 SS-4]|uniref:Uncharacterized protein n=1 Tax=Hypholoma sublateritium (strain FD-334 SS-4) TaxID=945553 RepID=A0A0D2NRN6_HYPSF|nr:hypothetical protein HYPSUDRAFT_204588 [Hypholoma sublateritium FD-334 SS-4]